MKHSELIQGQKYIDISDKRIPLIFNGYKLKNQGFNSFVYECEFIPVITEQNKNYNLPKIIYKCFPEEGSRQDIQKFINN